VVISYRRFVTDSLSRNVGKNYHYTLLNSPEECSSHLRRSGRFKSHIRACVSLQWDFYCTSGTHTHFGGIKVLDTVWLNGLAF